MSKLLLRHFFRMKFNIIQQRKNFIGRITNAQWTAFSFFILFYFILQIHPTNNYLGLVLGFLTIGLFSLIVYTMFDYEKLNANYIGDLIFEEEHLLINNEKITYHEIQKMELFTNHYKGEGRYPGSNGFFGPWNYIGKNNHLKIKCLDQRIFNIEFQILSHQDLKKINEFYAKLLLDEKISLYSHSLHHLPSAIKQTPSFLFYVLNLVDHKIIGKDYSQRVLRDED